ncbi:MAG: response regulator [Bdellovibrionota bacterium]|nr:response regulator [Bdellovibrionota bacterium]
MAEDEKKSKGKILVVDDSEDIRMLLSLKLRKAEYEVVLASDGMQALEMVDQHPDLKLIILDVMMPVMNGVQVMKFLLDKIEKKIAASEEGGNGEEKKGSEGSEEDEGPSPNIALKICFCTAKTDPKQINLAIQAGAHDYITKPIDESILLQKIDRLMGQDNAQMFAVMPCDLQITIAEFAKEKPSKMIELSEVHSKLEASFFIPDGTEITLDSHKLNSLFKVPVTMKGSVIFSEKLGPDLHAVEVSFQGLTEDDRTEIRSITTTKRELKDVEEDEDGDQEGGSEGQ